MHFFSWFYTYSVGQLGLQCDSNSQGKVFHKPAAIVPRRRASHKVRLLSSCHQGMPKLLLFSQCTTYKFNKKFNFLTDIFIAAVNTLHIKSSFFYIYKYIIDFYIFNQSYQCGVCIQGRREKRAWAIVVRKTLDSISYRYIYISQNRGGGTVYKRSRQDMSVCVLPVPVDRPKIARVQTTQIYRQSHTHNVLVLYV